MNVSIKPLEQSTNISLPGILIQILVPVYNEGENVRVLYHELLQQQVYFDVLKFIYDVDDDLTLPVISELQQDDPRVVAEKNDFGPGILKALRWGFSQCKAGPVLLLMGDNSDKLSLIPEMIEYWRNGAVVVCPSRYMKGGKQNGGGLLKSFLSRLAGVSLKKLGFPTADPTNNFKLYDGDWLRNQSIDSKGGFEVALELVFKAYCEKKMIIEIPTEWFDRTMGKSRFRLFKWLPHYLHWYFRAIGVLLNVKVSKLIPNP